LAEGLLLLGAVDAVQADFLSTIVVHDVDRITVSDADYLAGEVLRMDK